MNDTFDVDINEFLPLRDVVYRTLRKAILRGEFQPGERLMEIMLANKLGVSRTPVREAMRQLENEGLVIMIPRKGAQVAQITSQELHDVLEVRRSLEVLAAEKACERITPEEIERLRQAEQRFVDIISSDDITAVAEADVAFHDVIYNATGNRRLIQLLNNLREQMCRFRVEHLKNKDGRRHLAEEHRKILEAVVNQNVEDARTLTALHIENQQDFIDRSLEGSEGHGQHSR